MNKVLISDATGQALWSNLGTSSFTPGGNNTFLVTNGAGVVSWLGFNRNTTLVGDGITTALGLNLSNANAWTALQTFSNGISAASPVTLSSFASAGVVHNAAGGLLSSSLIVNGDITPGTIQNASLANSTIALSSSGSLTVTGSPISLGGAGTVNLNLANSNTWTGQQIFGGANTIV